MSQPFNVDLIRSQFPALDLIVNDQPLIYFDSAATAQKPQCVIDALSQYYSGGHELRASPARAGRASTAAYH